MYHVEDKNSAIKEVQRLLNLSTTGNYDEKTSNEVKKHQYQVGLNSSGIVDYDTFNSLVLKENEGKAFERTVAYLPAPPVYPYKFGDSGANVTAINILIGELANEYYIESRLPRGNYYGMDTANAISELSAIFLLEETDVVDYILLDRMINEKNAVNARKYY